MKFISKNQNLRVVLRHGMPAEPLTGRASVPGKYIRFEMGVANIPDSDTETIQLMLAHPGYDKDYMKVEPTEVDRWAGTRQPVEPEHSMMNIDFGHPGKQLNPVKPKLTLEMKKLVAEAAKELALPLAKAMLKEAMAEARNESAPAKRGPGRPKKAIKSDPAPVEASSVAEPAEKLSE